MNQILKLETKLSWKDYKNFNFYSFYVKPISIFITVIGVLMWSVVLFYFLGYHAIANDLFPSQQLIFAILMTIFLPGLIFWNAKRTFNANARFNESIYYTFDNTWIELKGESFESKFTWKKILKVKETKSWFLIFSNKVVANIIPKKGMTNEEILVLRKIIKSVPNLKSSLQKG